MAAAMDEDFARAVEDDLKLSKRLVLPGGRPRPAPSLLTRPLLTAPMCPATSHTYTAASTRPSSSHSTGVSHLVGGRRGKSRGEGLSGGIYVASHAGIPRRHAT
ncbi:hypothetical protein [Oryza sativa Japonica Group]|uniref:Uncharacterized protein n=1 Tax=Oryza sativa subsp. japonica TaxID=39947 RepID=Q5ZEH3_ORYSJ|nr:hypothetical protein [Oryza sativa Japonica Group]